MRILWTPHTVCVWGTSKEKEQEECIFSTLSKYSFKVKKAKFHPVHFQNKFYEPEQAEKVPTLTSRRQKKKGFYNYCCQSTAKPTLSFHALLPYSIVATEGVHESRIQQGKAKNPATTRSSRIAKEKAPKTVTIVGWFFFI